MLHRTSAPKDCRTCTARAVEDLPAQRFRQPVRYFGQNNLLHGSNVEDRMREVMCNASMARRALPEAEDIADPYRKEFAAFQVAHDQIGYAIADIAQALEPSRAGHATE